MSKRREKNKPQQPQLNKQLEPQKIAPPKERNESLVELGRFFYDLGKLVFGSDVLTILLNYDDYKSDLLIVGIVVMVLCFILGWILIKRGNKK